MVGFAPRLVSFVSDNVSGFAPDFVSAAAHRGDTGRAELRMFRFHAGGDLRYIRNELRAEPHGVGRAGLLDVRTHLGVGPISPESDTPANNASKQIKRTIRMGIPPVFESRFLRIVFARGEAVVQAAVDGLSSDLHVVPSASGQVLV